MTLRPGESDIGANDRVEPRVAAREASAMTRGIDADDEREWQATAMRLAKALREIRHRVSRGYSVRDTDVFAGLIDDALAETGLE